MFYRIGSVVHGRSKYSQECAWHYKPDSKLLASEPRTPEMDSNQSGTVKSWQMSFSRSKNIVRARGATLSLIGWRWELHHTFEETTLPIVGGTLIQIMASVSTTPTSPISVKILINIDIHNWEPGVQMILKKFCCNKIDKLSK